MADVEKELALRLAWYVDRYGAIPPGDISKLLAAATLGSKSEEAGRVTALAADILEYFRSMD